MDFEKIANGVLSMFFNSAASTYSSLSRNKRYSAEDRAMLRDLANDARERRNSAENGTFMSDYMSSSDDDDY